jgi:ribosomal protein L11 methyltransferase
VSSGANVLDVGCGSGILSIAAAKLGATAVFAFEIDSVAVEVASRNVENNDVSDKVFVAEGTLPHKDVRPGGYEVVVANISAKVILDLAEGLVAAAKAGGKLLLSGILDDHKELVTARIGELGARIETVETDEGWVVIQASKA